MIDEEGRALGVTAANWLEAPFNRWGFRHVPQLARTARLARGDGPVDELPRAERDLAGFRFTHGGVERDLDALLADTFTDGLLVLVDGAVAVERYLDGMASTDTHLLMSCSKSLTALLCGVLAGRGLLTPDDLVTDHVPELADTAWAGCRLQHLLDMRPGVAWDYDVDEYTICDVSDYVEHGRAGEIPTDTMDFIRTIPPGPLAHGEGPFRYCSLATDVLGLALERAGGAPFPELFAREIWSRIGAERDAEIIVDHAGFPVVEGGICTTLRDLGRVGLLAWRGGLGPDGRILDASWLARVTTRHDDLIAAFRASDAADPTRPEAFYHDAWWVDDGARGIYAAMGMNGQALLVHHPARVVIAKLSTFPDALDDGLFALHHAGMLALCEHLAAAPSAD